MPKLASGIPRALPDRPVRLLDRFRAWMRRQNYRYKTEQTYVHRVARFIRFHRMRHPSKMSSPEIEAFLGDLSLKRHCSVSTQRIALNALNCFYRKFLGIDFGQGQIIVREGETASTTQRYLHVLNRGGVGVISPVGRQ